MYWASRPLGCDVPRVLALPGGLVFFINKLFRNSFLISEPFVEDGPVSPGPRRLVPLGCLAPGVRLLILVTSFCLQDPFSIFGRVVVVVSFPRAGGVAVIVRVCVPACGFQI